MKHFEIVIEDGYYELYHDGEYVGTSCKIWLLRRWARQIWQEQRIIRLFLQLSPAQKELVKGVLNECHDGEPYE